MTKEIIKRGWDISAEGFDQIVSEDYKPQNRKLWLELLLSAAPQKENMHILDAGTGPGFFAVILSMAGHQVTGIDISEPMLKEAKKNADYFHVAPNFFKMDSQMPDFPESSFDFIISRNVVWTMDEPEKAYRNWFRLLSPGGKVVVIDGDHLRDLRDPEFRRSQDRLLEKYIEVFGSRPQVSYTDFETARGWRKDLPLVSCPRPQWDREVLSSLGYQNIRVRDISDIAYRTPQLKLLYQDSPLFMIQGERPGIQI